MQSRPISRSTLGLCLFLTLVCLATTAFAKGTSTPQLTLDNYRFKNLYRQRLAGNWTLNQDLNVALHGKKARERLVGLSFTEDSKALRLVPARMAHHVKTKHLPVVTAGFLTLRIKRRGEKRTISGIPYFVTMLKGEPQVMFFLDRGGIKYSNSESFAFMLVSNKRDKQRDVLFVGDDISLVSMMAFKRSGSSANTNLPKPIKTVAATTQKSTLTLDKYRHNNIYRQRLAGTWTLNKVLQRSIHGKTSQVKIQSMTLTRDAKALTLPPLRLQQYILKHRLPVVTAGFLTLHFQRKGKTRVLRGVPYLVSVFSGAMHIMFFLDRGGVKYSNPESFMFMLVTNEKEASRDLLFTGDDIGLASMVPYRRVSNATQASSSPVVK